MSDTFTPNTGVRVGLATALGRIAVVLLVASGLIAAYLTVALAPDVDPVRTVVSDYAFYRPGPVLLILGGRCWSPVAWRYWRE